MASEDEQMTIRTIFDLEDYNHELGKAMFKQRQPTESGGRFHFWAMDATDWNALGRPVSILMTISPYEEVA